MEIKDFNKEIKVLVLREKIFAIVAVIIIGGALYAIFSLLCEIIERI